MQRVMTMMRFQGGRSASFSPSSSSSSSSSCYRYSTTTIHEDVPNRSTNFQSPSSSGEERSAARFMTEPERNESTKRYHYECVAIVDAMSARDMVFFHPRCSEGRATTSYASNNFNGEQKGRIPMPFALAGDIMPSVHNNSHEIVNNVNVDVIEDALRRLEIAFPPASTTRSSEENEDEENNNGMWCKTHLTYQPSNLVRKRRHGFLARKRTVGGRRVLARRKAKRRRKMSA